MATVRSQPPTDIAVPPAVAQAVGLEAILERFAARLGDAARAANIFGEAVESEGVTVIPVATARWGMGGGAQKAGEAVGAGGGVTIIPTGFIEIRGGVARFRPLWDAKSILAGAALLGALLAWALKRK